MSVSSPNTNTNPYIPSIPYSGASTTGTNTNWTWTPEEKEPLVKIGFKYNKKTDCWELDLIATVSIPQGEGILEYIDQHKPCDRAIKIMKELKEKLIKKLTAKMILTELVKPRDIKA